MYYFFFFKQKTAYEMRISDWSSDVCSSDLNAATKPTAIIAVSSELSCARAFHRSRTVAPSIVVMARKNENSAAVLRSTPSNSAPRMVAPDRRSVVQGKSVSVRVDLGGRRLIKKKTQVRQKKRRK